MSEVWYHFTKFEGKGTCHHCQARISISGGSTGNLKRHLRLKHPSLEGGDMDSRTRSPLIKEEPGEVSNLTENITLLEPFQTNLPMRGIWRHFTNEEGKGKCYYCEAIISTSNESTWNLKRHLKEKHPSIAFERVGIQRQSRSPPMEDESHDVLVKRRNYIPFSSKIWRHFTKDKGKGKCHYCYARISTSAGSTGNLKRHLRLKHPSLGLDPAGTRSSSRSPLTENEMIEAENNGPIQIAVSPLILPDETQNMQDDSPNINFASLSPSNIQPSISTVDIKSKLIDIQLLKLICKEHHEFSIVENSEFKQFVKLLCPTYSLPSQEILSDGLLPDVYNKLLDKYKTNLIGAQAVSLTLDWWRSVTNGNYYSLTAHFLNEDTRFNSCLLECTEFPENHTSENISNWITGVLSKFDIQSKISAVVTENSTNLESAVANLNLPHITCFAHILNLVAQSSITNSIQGLVDKVQSAVQHYKQNSFALDKLQEMQTTLNGTEMKLKEIDPTRWNSTYEMLERFFFNKEPIISTFSLLETNLCFEPGDWEEIGQSLQILSGFNEVTKEVSTELNVFLSKSTVLIFIILKKIRQYLCSNEVSKNAEKLGNELIEGLSQRFGDRETNELIAQSILLDPRFKKQGFADDTGYNSAYQSIITKITETSIKQEQNISHIKIETLSIPSSSLWEEFDETVSKLQTERDPQAAVIVELNKYLAESYLPRSSDPLVWWEARKRIYPNLYKIVQQTMCIPATSLPCERIFTKAGQVYNQKRSRLNSERLTEMLFVNQNLPLI